MATMVERGQETLSLQAGSWPVAVFSRRGPAHGLLRAAIAGLVEDAVEAAWASTASGVSHFIASSSWPGGNGFCPEWRR